MFRNSFIFNFNKRVVRRGCTVFAFVCFICLQNSLLNYIYHDVDEWSRTVWHSYYAEDENIDNIFIGSSHVYCDINPFLMDELTDKNNFNHSGPALKLNAAYYILKEVIKEHKIENLYLEMYYGPNAGGGGEYDSSDSMKNGWRTTDYMKPSFNKVDALIHMNDTEHFGEAVFPFIRYRKYLTDVEYRKKTIEKKKTDSYLKYEYLDDSNGIIEYREKGFYYTERKMDEPLDFCYGMERISEDLYLPDDAEKYLRKIIELCKEENIKITLFTSPIYNLQMLSIDTYDRYAGQVRDMAEEYGIEYYDFNLCKEEYLPIQKAELFMDAGHLNTYGAEVFAEFFYKIMNQSEEENRNYFFQTFEEKIAKSKPYVYGLCYGDVIVGDDYMYHIAAGPREGLEYKVYITPKEGDTYMYQDFSVNKDILLPIDEDGICTIIWREIGKDTERELEVGY